MNDTARSKSVPANRLCLAMMETLEGRTLLCATDHEIAAFPASHLAGEYVAGVSVTSLLAGTGAVSAQVAPSLAAATVVTAGLPAGWASRDIGSGVRAGSTTETASDTYTIVGGGTDIYGAADSFRFAYGVLNGDGQVIARVDSVQLTHASAKAGVMIRESLAANSRNVSVVIKGGTGAVMQSRTATAGPTNYSKVNGPAAPEWVKLVRAGDKLTGYYSADGTTWQSLGTTTIAMSSTVYIGLAVTAHDATKLNTSSFSNVSVVPAGHPGSGAWTGTSVDIGNVGKAGYSSTGADGTVTVAGAGADIWNSSDAFRFNYQKLTGDGSIVARITSQQNTDPWAKAGIMLRETLATNSKFAFVVITPANGTFFGSRTSTGGMAKRNATSSYSLPLWLKLTRTGSTIVGYRSTNGATWIESGRATISMNGTVHVGLAVTSHRAGTLSVAKFDNVALTTQAPRWLSLAAAPVPKYEHAGMAVGGKLYSFGGFYNTAIAATTKSEVYDPATNKWTAIRDMPEAITHAGQATDGRYVYLVAGFIGDHPGPMTDHVWRYDTQDDVWTALPNLPALIGSGAAAIVGRTLYFFGGTNRDGSTYKNDSDKTWALDLDNASAGWKTKANLPVARNHLGGIALNGLIYAVGGQKLGSEISGNVNVVNVYNPATDAWSTVASLPIMQGHIAASTFIFNGKIRVIGGVTQNSLELDTQFEYDPATNKWTTLDPIPGRRQSPLADTIDGVIYVSGGYEPGTVYTTTWRSAP
jgi:N-acetylneuraminic acid mutarotase